MDEWCVGEIFCVHSSALSVTILTENAFASVHRKQNKVSRVFVSHILFYNSHPRVMIVAAENRNLPDLDCLGLNV